MATDDKRCLLLRLSAELRNGIYELVLLSEDSIDMRTESQPGLAKTCRQIRKECIQIYYGQSKFGFVTASTQDDALEGITQWLERIGSDHCRTLRTIKIKIGVPNGLMLNDSTNPETPWKIMIERMKKLDVTNAIKIEVELYPEPLKASMAQLVALNPTLKETTDRLQEHVAQYLSIYLACLVIKYIGWRGHSGHECSAQTHGSTLTSHGFRQLVWSAARTDYELYAGRPKIAARRKPDGDEEEDSD
ncbi:hypothetical protein LTR27_000738 [Elasticomyces elasticus]|nr:hypothetical protein LTR27_000738 [Elasticomyces elasticus]